MNRAELKRACKLLTELEEIEQQIEACHKAAGNKLIHISLEGAAGSSLISLNVPEIRDAVVDALESRIKRMKNELEKLGVS